MKHTLELVGVGASAGGLDALIDFFKGVPADCASAFLVIQHLSPDHESMMDELLAPHTKLPVVDAVDGMQLDGGSIYLCPPGVIPRVDKLTLNLELHPKSKPLVLPINILFESIARTLGASGAVVVLSGSGSDGSEGLLGVEQQGGIVAVQSPESADVASMPQSAISTGKCHIIAPAEQLWREIESYAEEGSSKSAGEEEPQLTSGDEPSPLDSEEYVKVFHYLEDLFGLDFSRYRINSVSRRLTRRMNLLAISDLETYLQYLKKNDDEAKCLYQDILIGVTGFFRDAKSFESLNRQAIQSAMTAERQEDFRIWSAGCATGQEAYSLYILADEVRREVGFPGRIVVFATDVFKPSLEFAGRGVYSAKELSGLSSDRLNRYFEKFDSGHYKIHSDVRSNIIFAQHNFLTDTPFTNIDIVSCRNVLIYLKPETQEAAFSAFAYALRERGFLFLGGSESLGKFEDAFKVISNKAKIFQKHGNMLGSSRLREVLTRSPTIKHMHVASPGASVTINRDLLNAYDSLLERFAPCGFLVNKDCEVLHYFGDSANFCVNVTGRANLDLTEQLDKHLRLAVKAMLHLAERDKERTTSKGIRCKSSSGECLVDIVVNPLQDLQGEVRNFLIEIHRLKGEDFKDPPSAEESSVENAEIVHTDEHVKLLEDQLKFATRNLEASHEELQVSNEELHAVNEEYQVSKEELQSANEELQSTNEELSTLNAEYERKNEELIKINTTHENLLKSTEDGILFVDKDIRIRQFNAPIKNAFSIMPSDVGRPLQDIAYHMDDAVPLLDDVRAVLETGERIERETALKDGHFFMKRITPFLTEGGKIDGALLTYTEVTEIRRLEARFQFALETASISWWDWDLVKDTIEVTSGGTCLLGEGCLDFTHDKEGWMGLVHPEDQAQVRKTLDDCLEGRTEEWICEHRFRTTSGEWLWVSNQGVVKLRDESGNPLEMMGTTRDVDSYKRALVEAQNQQAVLEATDEISKVGAWEYDPETQNIFWSSEIRRILEVGEDFVPTVEKTFKMMPSMDSERLQKAFELTCSDGTPYDLQLHFITANGVELLCRSASRARFDEKGKIVRVVGIFQDITELTMIEEELKAFFDLSPDFQATLALDGSFKYWSPSWEKNLGYTDEELLSIRLSDLVAEVDREAFNQVLGEAAAGSVVTSYETRIISKSSGDPSCDAKEAWLSWSFSSSPELSLIFVSARCVTQQKKAQQELEEARLRAEEANRAKSDFLAVMSHELRTPLNPILGFSDLLIDEAESEEQKEICTTIAESGRHMISLIDEILTYSKIDAGKEKVEPEEFSLSDFVRSKTHLMKGQIKGAPVEFHSSLDFGPLDESRQPIFWGDVGMLRQVCRNLISNAIKFTPEGEINFDVSVREVESDRAVVQFEVKDSGIGISEKDRSKLFKPFSQVETGSTREYGGTGLGLAICKRLVNLMDGSISVESKEEKGSVFRFSIPLKFSYAETAGEEAADEEATDAPAESVPDELTSASPRRGEVLLVEDNKANAFFVEKLLGKRGVAVKWAETGEDALKQMEARDYDLVLLDLHMPGIGGLETLKRIRSSKDSKVPVYVLTADADPSVAEVCLENGANRVFTKPFKPGDIEIIFGEALKA